MKRINHIITSMSIGIGSLLLVSCSDFLSIEPLNSVVVENYWKSKGDVEAVVTSCYTQMQSQDFTRRIIAWGELRADNITETSGLTNNTALYNLYINNITTDNVWTSWAPMYDVINLCNTVLYYAPSARDNDGTFTEDELNAYEAEVRAIRALCYFYLIRTFQKVPLVLNATIGDDESFQIAASSENDVCAQIISDLTWAENYIWDASYFDDTAERKGRMNKLNVKAILADVYLWEGEYSKCANLCKEIMDAKMDEYKVQQQEVQNGNYNTYTQNGALTLYEGYPLIDGNITLHNAYDKIFSDGNSFESLLEIQYNQSNEISNNGLTYFYGNNTTLGSGLLNVASWIVGQSSGDLFSDKSDSRLIENTGYDGTTTSQSYYIHKYRYQFYGKTTATLRTTYANWIVYRLTDVMLMRAEALAYLGGSENTEESFGIVKAVNERSCAGTTKLVYNEDNMKEMVRDERQRELMLEGKRWYDLVRMVRHADSPVQMMSQLRNSYLLRKYEKNGTDAVARLASVNNLYLPFYQSEIDVNPLLAADQNPAY